MKIFTWKKDVNGNYYRRYFTLAEFLQRVRKSATTSPIEVKQITVERDLDKILGAHQ